MLFNSYLFLAGFLPLTLLGVAVTSRRPTAVRLWLVTCSLVFYGWWNPVFVPMLLASVLGNFLCAEAIHGLRNRPRARAWVTAGGIAINLAVLIRCKYLATWLAGPDAWLSLGLSMQDLLVPIGISFFTFTQIGYLLDCAAGVEVRRRLLDYLLFTSFFPALIAGPIQTSRETMRQIAERVSWRLRAEDLAIGSGIFLIGLLKKTLLADPLADTVAAGFADPGGLTLLPAWQTALSYSMQLYFDFSGYSDMAIGLARMFGLQYPLNFASPYKAASVIDYWQRWHMSLTRFFMRAIHAPLAMTVMRWRQARRLRSDRSAQQTPLGFLSMILLPIAVTMGLAGIWHGAGATFAVFGLMHAGFLSVNHAWRLHRPRSESGGWKVRTASIALTYLCVLAGAVVFRAPDLASAGALLAAMGGAHGWVVPDVTGRGMLDVMMLAGLCGIVWLAPNTQQIMGQGEAGRWRWQPTLPWAVAFGSAASLGLLSLGGTSEFLYFQF